MVYVLFKRYGTPLAVCLSEETAKEAANRFGTDYEPVPVFLTTSDLPGSAPDRMPDLKGGKGDDDGAAVRNPDEKEMR